MESMIALDMGEMPSPEIYSEHLTYLQDFVQRLQSDLDDGRDGTTAQKERTIMDSILARLDALINNDEGSTRRYVRCSEYISGEGISPISSDIRIDRPKTTQSLNGAKLPP
jgi:predicted component of type VI protein secretion system